MHSHSTYRHRQWATLILALLGIFAAFLAVVLVAGTREEPALIPAILGVFSFTGVLALLFHSLVVEVSSYEEHRFVRVQFGWGPIRRTIPLADIRSARAVRNSWWYGWGVRLTPRGWLWNVSGLDAVELELISGKHFRIGTDEPKRLARAVEEALADAGRARG